MPIVFNCQYCGEPYKLKDELAGRSATCRNPNCRKSFIVPAPTKALPSKRANPPASKPSPEPDIDIDTIAAAALSEEPEQKGPSGKPIDVVCRHCDHNFTVEPDKAGKMVICPDCGRPTKVPAAQAEKKLDWRNNDGIPTLAKRDFGDMSNVMDARSATVVEGKTIAAAGAIQLRDAEEPEERRKRRIKTAIYLFLFLAVIGTAGYGIWGYGKAVRIETTMAKAVEAIESPNGGATDPIFHALMRRASGEYKSRIAASEDDVKSALKDLQLARNLLMKVPTTNSERDAVLIEVALTFPVLAGDEEQVRLNKKKPWTEIQREIRQTLAMLNPQDREVIWYGLRLLTERLVQYKQPLMAADIATSIFPIDTADGQVALAQVGFELLRLGKVEEASKIPAMVLGEKVDPMFQGLKLALNKEAKEDPKKKEQPDPMALAMAAIVQGDVSKAKSQAEINSTLENRSARLVQLACQCPAEKAPDFLNTVADILKLDKNASAWLYRRLLACLLRANQIPQAETLSDLVPNPGVKAWCKLDLARYKLAAMTKKKADDSLLDLPGDPTKSAAAAKIREEIARHNAFAGEGAYSKVIDRWEKGVVRPFGQAGWILGKQDRDGK